MFKYSTIFFITILFSSCCSDTCPKMGMERWYAPYSEINTLNFVSTNGNYLTMQLEGDLEQDYEPSRCVLGRSTCYGNLNITGNFDSLLVTNFTLTVNCETRGGTDGEFDNKSVDISFGDIDILYDVLTDEFTEYDNITTEDIGLYELHQNLFIDDTYLFTNTYENSNIKHLYYSSKYGFLEFSTGDEIWKRLF